MENSNRRVQYLVACSVSLVTASVGCFVTWPAPVLTKFHNNETNVAITNEEMAWMVAIASPGYMIGSLTAGHLSDRFGRKAAVLGSAGPAIAGMLMITFTTTSWLVLVGRFLAGCSTGMATIAVSLYLAEIADKEIRGTLSLVSRFMFNFGNLFTMAVGPFVSYDTLNYILLSLPFGYLMACWWIPESPYYYLKGGKVDAARKVLMKIRGGNDEVALEDNLQQMKSHVRNEMRNSSSIKELFSGKQYRKAIIIIVGLKITQMFSGLLVLMQYIGLIMNESQTNLKISTVLIVFGFFKFAAGIMSSILVDRLGRRPLLIFSYLGTGISLAIVSFYFFLLDNIRLNRDILTPYSFLIFGAIIFCNIISTLGYNSLIFVISAEIFPLNVKARAMTFANIFGGMLNFFLAISYQAVKDWTGLSGVFFIFALSSVAGGLFSAVFVLETKGKSLKEIQEQLQGDLYEIDEASTKFNQVHVKENKELKEFNSGNPI